MKHFYSIFIFGLIHVNIAAQQSNSRLGSSGSCNVNVNCTEGAAWNLQKRSVIKIFTVTNSINVIGTGVLLNNTRNDYSPYVLTAYHVIQDLKSKDYSTISFYFNYESPSCENIDNDSLINKQIIKGFELIAFSKIDDLDFALVKLNHNVPKEFNSFFAGWSKLETDFTSGVCIHHPNGDIKKISTIGTLNKDSFHSWNIGFKQTENGHGITEYGSSGSPIFNSEGLVVGTLNNGSSDCDILDGIDNFGRFSINSDYYSDSLSNLKKWLDPDNTGIQVLQGIALENTVVPNIKIQKPFTLFPNPCINYLTIKFSQDKIPQTIRLYDSFGKIINCIFISNAGQQTLTIDLTSIPSGIYLVSLDYFNFMSNQIIIKQ